jgi:hypothetical protein
MSVREPSFGERERADQTTHFEKKYPKRLRYRNSDYRLVLDEKGFNLSEEIRATAPDYFSSRSITWHTHSNHALSSQVCCLNFLMPLAHRPDVLGRLVGAALGIEPPQMLAVEKDTDGRPWYIAFEWNAARRDYLNEAGKRPSLTRGSNSTSADAYVEFIADGRREALVIEWKYTESYGAPLSKDPKSTRKNRYGSIFTSPDGPVRANQGLTLEDFFYEPFYQLLRQQMLAFQLQRDPAFPAIRVRVLHISPKANLALHAVTSPRLKGRASDDAFEVFKSLLVRPEDFVNCYTEELFGPLLAEIGPGDPWRDYLVGRYRFLGA